LLPKFRRLIESLSGSRPISRPHVKAAESKVEASINIDRQSLLQLGDGLWQIAPILIDLTQIRMDVRKFLRSDL
jgi:hypothetical protein